MSKRSKRAAETQITKDDAGSDEDSSVGQEGGTWNKASEDKLAQRKFVKVRRKTGAAPAAATTAAAAPAFPTFNFGVAEPTPTSTETKAAPTEGGEVKEGKSEKETETNGKPADAPAWPLFSFGSDSGTPSFTFGSSFTSGSLGFGDVTASASGSNSFAAGTPDLATAEASLTPTSGTSELFKDKTPIATGTEQDETIYRVRSKVYVLKTVDEKGKETKPEETNTETDNKDQAQAKEQQANGSAHEAQNGDTPAEGAAPKEGGESNNSNNSNSSNNNNNSKTEGKENKKFLEVGLGELHLNKFPDGEATRYRLVLRAEKTQRLVLNAPVFPKMQYSLETEKFVRFLSFDLEGEAAVYLLKVKTKADAMELMAHLDRLTHASS